jgi:hypothetical protein
LGDICDSCLTSSWAELRATVVLIAVSVGEVVVEAGPMLYETLGAPVGLAEASCPCTTPGLNED